MINKDFFAALTALEAEGKINKALFVESLEAGLAAAYKKETGEARYVNVRLNEEKGEIKVYAYKLVVEEVEDEDKEISLEDAKQIKSAYQIGDKVTEEVTTKALSRIAAQTGKQVIMQRLNEARKSMMVDEMNEKENEILTAVVRRIDGNTVYLEISGTQLEGVMMPSDQIAGEKYSVNQHIKVLVKSIKTNARGANQVIVSRANTAFVKRLFEMEVPELKSGLIYFKKIVREAGYRTKLAVATDDKNIDAVGSCIGQRGMRINNIVQELNGEKIDIIPWSANPVEFISKAMSPASVSYVKLDEENKSASVIVADDKLSLAIGKAGQNVRLAAKLTEWKIDVKPLSSLVNAQANNEEENEEISE